VSTTSWVKEGEEYSLAILIRDELNSLACLSLDESFRVPANGELSNGLCGRCLAPPKTRVAMNAFESCWLTNLLERIDCMKFHRQAPRKMQEDYDTLKKGP
jgi:hypothetical protein